MNLVDVPKDCAVRVRALTGTPALRKRFIEMGLAPGMLVRVTRVAPLGDPLVVAAGEARISLRRRDAAHILVEIPREKQERS